MKRCFAGVAGIVLAALPAWSAPNALGVVRSSQGEVKIAAGGAVPAVAEATTLVRQGSRIETGDDGKAMLRLVPDYAFLDVRPRSAFILKRVKTQGKRVRRLSLEAAEVLVGLKKKSEPVQCETAQTVATGLTGRFSCHSDGKGAANFLVQDGELSVYNRPKEVTVIVRSGQKAISNLDGVKVTDATDAEMDQAGFSQNTLEVDFVNPQSEDFTTLEVEYETNF